MRARTRGALATIARSVAVYVAIVAGAAAIGTLVGALVLGEWFIGAGLAACLAAWLALPTGMLEARGGEALFSDEALRPHVPEHPYRLYDTGVVINRALVYAALTALLVAVYVGSVVSLQGALRALTGQESQLAVVASTLAVAAIFDPLNTVSRRSWIGASTGGSMTQPRPLKPSLPSCAPRQTWTPWATT